MRFGPYESCDFPYHGPLTVVYPVRGADERRLAVQALEGSPDWSASRRRNERELFFSRLSVQKQVFSSSRSSHWAPVYEDGSAIGEPWYCTDLYPMSCAQLVEENSLRLKEAGLRNIVRGIIQGLIELRDSAGRGHGALTPGNVLLTSLNCASAQIKLCDPAPNAGPAAGSKYRDDQEALASLIHRLVVKREAGAELATSPDWARLGPTAGAWLQFCGRLSNADSRFARWEDALRAIPKPPKVLPGRLAVVACIVLAAAIAVVLLVKRSKAHPVTNDAERWNQLCDDYQWFGPLLDRFDQLPESMESELVAGWGENVEPVRHHTNPLELARAADESSDATRWQGFTATQLELPLATDQQSVPPYISALKQFLRNGWLYQDRALEKIVLARKVLSREGPGRLSGLRRLRDATPVVQWKNLLDQVINKCDNSVETQRLVGVIDACCLSRTLANFDPALLNDELKAIGLDGQVAVTNLDQLPVLGEKAARAAALANRLSPADADFISKRDQALSKATTPEERLEA